MDRMRIVGGRRLQGEVQAGGSKNAALPILFSALLSGKGCRFERVPDLEDIRTTLKLLAHLGLERESGPGWVKIKPIQDSKSDAPYDLVRKMRASVLALGPLVARFGHARVSLPGGCAIGARPIGFHLAGLEKLGAEITLEQGYVNAKAKRLTGARVRFDFPSVGATENVLMAAVLAKGSSVLENCAREPEIVDLARALRAMGARISGEGSETIEVEGVDHLGECKYAVMGDRIEAGTYLAAALATRGSVKVTGIAPEFLEAVLVKFEETGAKVERGPDFIRVDAKGRAKPADVTTQPYPGFPTDMQAQFMAVLAVADGASIVSETIFENRFMHVPELARLGADISIKGNTAMVRGREKLTGAPLMATDLRASASLVIGALAAEGESIVNRIYHLDRGYERMEAKLAALGADVERIR